MNRFENMLKMCTKRIGGLLFKVVLDYGNYPLNFHLENSRYTGLNAKWKISAFRSLKKII